ncbi:MAG: Bifunctional oligoribonuclease and PAP phosphatase NrnA [Phycisphaerae bacterium]|nr:Bifunctional oligoribonuclease and PAP phosphatase NrnA [Phycisphaerae bacterium]
MPSPRQSVIDRINAALRVLILTHARPDGDALGSSIGLQLSLIGLGKSADFVLLSDAAAKYDFLLERHVPIRIWQARPRLADYDAVVIVDTSSLGQLEGLADEIEAHPDLISVIDHHASGDRIGSVRWIDPSAPSAGSMVLDLIRAAGWPFDAEIAEALFIALATDTGWFRFSNTTPDALRSAADLLEAGLSLNEIYQRVYLNESAQRVTLGAEMLGRLELFADGRVAVACITQEMFRRHGAAPKDTEGLIDMPQVIGSVIVTVLMVERPADLGGGVRLSLRSKRDADVNAIAMGFGGGGHVRAAGAKVHGETIESLKPRVVEACVRALGG